MKNLRNTILILMLAALSCTGLFAMDQSQAPKVDTFQELKYLLPDTLLAQISQDLVPVIAMYHPDLIVKDVKNALEAGIKGCDLMGGLYVLLLQLIKIYDVDLLVVPLAECFKKNPTLVYMKNFHSYTVLYWAVHENEKALVKLLLDALGQEACKLMQIQDEDSNTPLEIAEKKNNEAMVQLLEKYLLNQQ